MARVELDCGFDSVVIGRVNEIVGIWPFRITGISDSVGTCSENRKRGFPHINKALSPIGCICSLLASIPWADSIRFVRPNIDYKVSRVSLGSHVLPGNRKCPYRLRTVWLVSQLNSPQVAEDLFLCIKGSEIRIGSIIITPIKS